MSLAHYTAGWASSNFPVVYGSVPRASNYEPAAAVAHFAQTLEKIFAHPRSGPRFIWRKMLSSECTPNLCTTDPSLPHTLFIVFDMAGYTMKHAMLVRVALGYATTFSRHYPERLEAVVLLNPTPVWDVALALVRPFLDQRTLSKVRPVHAHGAASLTAALAALDLGLGPEILDWVASTQLTMPPLPRTLPLPLPAGSEGLRLVEPPLPPSPPSALPP